MPTHLRPTHQKPQSQHFKRNDGAPPYVQQLYRHKNPKGAYPGAMQEIQYTTEKALHITYKGIRMTLDKLLQGDSKLIWNKSLGNEVGCIAQGIPGRVKGNDTVEYIPKSAVPLNKKVTYANFVCNIRPNKAEVHRVRLTVGGDQMEYTYDTTSLAASLLETKLLISSVISDVHLGAFHHDRLEGFLPPDSHGRARIHAYS